jgi:hypothetical protein
MDLKLGRYWLEKKPFQPSPRITFTRPGVIASTLVSLEERMNILAKPDDGAGPKGFVGFSVQIFLRGLDDIHSQAGLS